MPCYHITDLQRPWRRVRARAGLSDMRIHGLRHISASNAVGRGLSIQMVGKLLGHTQIQTTMRYSHLADDPIAAPFRGVRRAFSHHPPFPPASPSPP
jgi:site-specific recombinase XerD